MWQQQDPENRLQQYHGPAFNNSDAEASLHDVMDMGTLAESVHVHDIIDTQAGVLCYRY